MLYLLFTVVLNTVLFSLFKLFPKFGVDGLQAIVVNYFVCVVTGSIFMGSIPLPADNIQEPWFPWSILMGVLFISLFNLMAWRTKEDGMTTTTVANKLSLVIPVVFSVLAYGEQLNALKIVGILAAFPAVYLTTRRHESTKNKSIFFSMLLFVGSGTLDTLVKYVEVQYLQQPESQTAYTIYVLGTAAVIGFFVVLVRYLRGKLQLHWRNVLAGVLLGIPNYFSIYFFIRLLNSDFLQSSAAIPVNNVGIVLLSTLVAIVFFREPATKQRIVGLALSVVAIVLIALSELHGTI